MKVLHGGAAGVEDAREAGSEEGVAECGGVDLDELCRLAAREMIAVALQAERRAYLEAHAQEVDVAGRRLVVGNGYARQREITTAAGRVEVRAPRVDDRRDGKTFTSIADQRTGYRVLHAVCPVGRWTSASRGSTSGSSGRPRPRSGAVTRSTRPSRTRSTLRAGRTGRCGSTSTWWSRGGGWA